MRTRKEIEAEIYYSGKDTYGEDTTIDRSLRAIGETLLDIRELLANPPMEVSGEMIVEHKHHDLGILLSQSNKPHDTPN